MIEHWKEHVTETKSNTTSQNMDVEGKEQELEEDDYVVNFAMI